MPDLRMEPASVQLAFVEPGYKANTRGTHGAELIQQILKSLVAVVPHSRHCLLIRCRQVRRVLVEHDANAACKITLVFLDEMANNFSSAPLTWARMPARGPISHAIHRASHSTRLTR